MIKSKQRLRQSQGRVMAKSSRDKVEVRQRSRQR